MGDSTFGDVLDELPPPTGGQAELEGACPECEGRGWIIEADGGAGTARPCRCLGQERGKHLLTAAGIPARYRDYRLADFDTSWAQGAARHQLQEALTKSIRYVDGFIRSGSGFSESGLIYIGPAGTGKTHLAVSVLLELVESYGVRGRFVDFTSLIAQIQSTFHPESGASQHSVLKPVIEADVLVLDELGAQKPSDWVQDILYLVINTRYTEQRPTIFTTNYSLADRDTLVGEPKHEKKKGLEPLLDRVRASLVSRLHEMASPILMTAVSDFRSDDEMRIPRGS